MFDLKVPTCNPCDTLRQLYHEIMRGESFLDLTPRQSAAARDTANGGRNPCLAGYRGLKRRVPRSVGSLIVDRVEQGFPLQRNVTTVGQISSNIL
jgi:hypothetical protein